MALMNAPAAAVEIPPLRPASPPEFAADLVLSVDAEARPVMAITVSVPYPALQWIRLQGAGSAARHGAALELAVSFKPRRGQVLQGDTWERRVVVGSYAATTALRSTVVERRSFPLGPGHYNATVRVRDLNSGLESVAREGIDVPDYSRVPVGFTDLELGAVDSTAGFVSVPSRVFGAGVRRLAALATLFDRRPGAWPRSYALRYRVVDDLGTRLHEDTVHVEVGRSAAPILIQPHTVDLFVGSYVLEVELAGERTRWRV